MDIDVDTVGLDSRCKDILRKMKAFGYDRPEVAYIADEADFSENDLSYLLRNGGLSITTGEGTYRGSVLGGYGKAMFGGPDAGKISFKLKVGLA
ncbi:hypothetical protein [Burkholderia glumae]|uniref:hypothetical protein n=1 Tax=Burkholderia glumae TaxID=337 RepID=UPI002150CFD4|nr:hypothetical protein [Burkholderia glumae]